MLVHHLFSGFSLSTNRRPIGLQFEGLGREKRAVTDSVATETPQGG